ncbi:MAG TPA: ABC transporter permease [Blastocatellia bacterium]|nr:ABC transporter permease [Blastocatellia bacterium]
MLSKLKTRLRAVLLKSEMERELDEELRYHIEQQTEQNIRLGMNPEEAKQSALKSFGGVEQAKERSRDARGVRWLENCWQDIRFGVRMLLNKPGFTLIAVITLALGIGANSVIFSFFNGILLRPLPFQQPERLVLLDEIATNRGGASLGVSWPNYLDWRAQNQAFSDLGCYQDITFTLTGVGDAEELSGAFISDRLFEALGVAPQLGRAFLPEENQPARHRVVILSHGLWQRRFGGDQKILGKTITLVNRAWMVVGVMPPGFKFPGAVDFWAPLAHAARWSRSMHGLGAIARLKPGATIEQAQSEMSLIARRLAEQYPASNEGLDVRVTGLRDHLVKDYRRGLWILLGAVGAVLLIACANVANLLLARAAARRREMAIRAALGAGRFRIVRQMLCESLLLGVLGGAVGMALAWLGLNLLLAALPAELPFWMKFNVDGRVLGFTLAVSLLTSLACGAAPSWNAARIDLIETLKDGGRGAAGGSRQHLRRLLVTAQVALALILLAGAGLLMRSFLRLQQVRLGFNPDNVLTLRVTVTGSGYRGGSASFFHQLVERVNALPGVEVASAIIPLPLSGIGESWDERLTVEGQPALPFGQAPIINDGRITPHYFRTMEIPLLAGRAFNDADTRDTPRVAIVDERLAREYWPSESPLGKRIRFGPPENNAPWHTIVGVVGTVQHERLDAAMRKMVYVPNLQNPVGFQTLVVRSNLPRESLIPAVKNVVKEMDPNLPITHVETMREVIAESVWQPRLYATLFAVFSVVALTLAAVGIYGVMSYAVTARTNEIGIRMALGAERRHVLKLVVGHGMALALGGVGVGLAGALLLTRLMKTLLFGVSATDPLTFAGVSLLLFSVALLACYLPARKATQVDPLVALRRD